MSFTIAGKRYRKSTGVKNKKIAEKIYREKIKEIMKLRYRAIENENILFYELIEKYEKFSKASKSSYKNDKVMLRVIREYFPNKPVIMITVEEVESFKNFLIEKRKISKTTVNRYLALLKAMFNRSIEWYGVPIENPVKKIRFFKERNRARILSKEEIEKILFYAEGHTKTAIIVGLFTCARLREILNLEWNDINFEQDIIRIRQEKTNKEILIPLHPELKRYLLKIKEKSNGRYIVSYKGNKVKSIKKSFERVKRISGVRDIWFHDIRRTGATYLIMNGVDISLVSKMLGHNDIKVTMRYINPPSDFLVQKIKNWQSSVTILSQLGDEESEKQ